VTYDLFIGDRTFSSWSLRGWLMLEKFGLPYRTTMVGLYSGTMAADLAALAPARTVPVLRTPDGAILTDTLAMAETLAEQNPDAGLWPLDAAARGLARSMVAEMHSGFGALRGDCPMMLAHAWDGFVPADSVRDNLNRIEDLWHMARDRHGAEGIWLFGAYSLADAFYAPVAARIATYGLPIGDPAFRRWRAMGLTRTYDPMPYLQPLAASPWPGPAPLPAAAVTEGTAENATCPYSGDPVTHLMQMEGRIFGFCNAFCRDKTVADPAAWPAFMAIV
jgi:glutathione S-transferase